MSSNPDHRRAARLHGVFKDALAGKRDIQSALEAKLFLESIQNEKPPSKCVEKIISSHRVCSLR